MSEWLQALHAHWLVQLCELLGKLAVLVAIGFWLYETDERDAARHSQAWMVLAAATDARGEMGRKRALHTLARGEVRLDGVNLDNALVTELHLPTAELSSTSFRGADLGRSDFRGADLRRADFTGADLLGVRFDRAKLDCALFCNADVCDPEAGDQGFCMQVAGRDDDRADFWSADLRHADLRGAKGLSCQMLATADPEHRSTVIHDLDCEDGYDRASALAARQLACDAFAPRGCDTPTMDDGRLCRGEGAIGCD